MKNLDQRQREMRERNKRAKPTEPKEQKISAEPRAKAVNVKALEHRISELESENAALRRENAMLRQSGGRPVKSADEERREQVHNFFKYSNARRY